MRKAANISPEDMWKIFNEQALDEDGCLDLTKSIEKDLKVDFDFENCEWVHYQEFGQWEGMLGFREIFPSTGLKQLSYIGIEAGGDWEYPVYFIVYLDQDGKTLRAYIPKEGNAWNYDTKKALGNDDVADEKFLRKFIKNNDLEKHNELKLYEEEEGHTTHFDDPYEGGNYLFNKAKIQEDIKNRIEVVQD